MSRLQRTFMLGASLVAGACSRPDGPVTAPDPGPAQVEPAREASPVSLAAGRARHERLARRMALALNDPGFRRRVYQAIAGSRYPEQKVQLQAFLGGNGGAEGRALAALVNEDGTGIARDLAGGSVEMYFPVAAHRTRWHGGTDLLVATAELDRDAPVAYDLAGRPRRLDPNTPPDTPVLMVSRAELDFDTGPEALACLMDCDAGGSGGTVATGATGSGLFMTRSRIPNDFEGWFKGNPEFEIHVLGQDGNTSALTSYQCAGEHAGGPYAFDQNGSDWSGSVMLFSQTQLDAYRQAHPGKNLVIFVVEDDDTACQIKIDSTRTARLLTQVSQVYSGLTAGKDSTLSSFQKIFKFAPLLYYAYKAVSSVFQTNDDPVGNAVNDVAAASAYLPGANWIIRGENSVVNGALTLEMR